MSWNKEELIQKLQKLLALSERGVDGEASAAKRRLDALLLEYGVSLEDITDTVVSDVDFFISNSGEKKLLINLAAKVLNDTKGTFLYQKLAKGKLLITLSLTRLQAWEIQHSFEIYRECMEKEKKKLLRQLRDLPTAFIMANKIFCSNNSEAPKLTEAEKERLRRIYRQSQDIKPVQIRKALQG